MVLWKKLGGDNMKIEIDKNSVDIEDMEYSIMFVSAKEKLIYSHWILPDIDDCFDENDCRWQSLPYMLNIIKMEVE